MKTASQINNDLVTVFLTIVALYFGNDVVIPLVLSGFLFIFLDPCVEWAERKNIRRKISAPLLVVIFVCLSVLACWGGYGTCANLVEKIPRYSNKIHSVLTVLQRKANDFTAGTNKLLPEKSPQGDVQKVEMAENPKERAWLGFFFRGVNSVFSIFAIALLIPVLSLFLLLEKDHLYLRLTKIVGAESLSLIKSDMTQMVWAFFLGNLVVGIITASTFLILFFYLGLENSVALAIFSGFVNLIPILGSVLAPILPVIQAVLQFDTVSPVLLIFGFSIGSHFFVANFVMPKIVGSKINVNASAATVGFFFWGWAWGGLGVLLTIPLMAVLRSTLSLTANGKPWAELIAEKKVTKIRLIR